VKDIFDKIIKNDELSIEKKWKECISVASKIKEKYKNKFIKKSYNYFIILIEKDLKRLESEKHEIDEIIYKNSIKHLKDLEIQLNIEYKQFIEE
jgi:hypothetical protein